jgi:hypothetical protein
MSPAAAERWLFENRGCFTMTPLAASLTQAVVEARGVRLEREVSTGQDPDTFLPDMVGDLRREVARRDRAQARRDVF